MTIAFVAILSTVLALSAISQLYILITSEYPRPEHTEEVSKTKDTVAFVISGGLALWGFYLLTQQSGCG
jgi:hypothetical protein